MGFIQWPQGITQRIPVWTIRQRRVNEEEEIPYSIDNLDNLPVGKRLFTAESLEIGSDVVQAVMP